MTRTSINNVDYHVATHTMEDATFFAVVATTIVLISVFTPLMFLPGYIGRLFVELAVAIAAAVASSSVAARLPSVHCHARPRRPRPVSWRVVTSQSWPGSPAAPRSSAIALVEPTLSCASSR